MFINYDFFIGNEIVPYYMVGDAAFPLTTYLMTPYSGRFIDEDRFVYNKRLSRARRIIENSFGILAARWRIYHTTIILEPTNADKVIKASLVLHNMLCEANKHNYSPNLISKNDVNPFVSFPQIFQENETLNASHNALETRNAVKNWIDRGF